MNFRGFFVSLFAVFFGLLMGAVIIYLIGKDPIKAYAVLWKGAFGTEKGFLSTLTKATPLILTGLSVAFSFRCGLFNIGAEGQLYMGAITAAYLGFKIAGLPSFIHLPLVLIAGALAGAFWGFVPGWLKAKRGVHEVINTIMMNYIAILFTDYLVTGPLMTNYVPKTPLIAKSAMLPTLLSSPPIYLSAGILVSLLCVYIVDFILRKTVVGYEVRAVGFNPYAAEYGGISIGRNFMLAMSISGALAGLAGAIDVCGVYHRFYGGLSGGKGFDGISVALVAQNNPWGVILAALLFASLRTGSNLMQLEAGIPKHIVFVIQGIVIFTVACERAFRTYFAFKERRKESA